MMNLDKRQKVIVALIILALAVLVWQIYKIASSENAAPSSTATPSMAAKSTNYPAAAQAVRNNAVETAAMLSNTASNSAPAVTDNSDAVGANQQKYLELVNEYQMSEIQRMIAEDQASIAQARYTAAEALSKISALSGGSANLSDLAGTTDQTNPTDYELIYTGEDNGQWTATIKKNGQFNDVTAGSVLSDGANVLSVDDNGVLLQIGSKKELVTFNGVTPFDSSGQATNAPNTSPSNLQNQITKKSTANLNVQTTATPLTQTTQPQTAQATTKTPEVQTQTATIQNKTPAIVNPPKPSAPKIAAVVTGSPVPVAASVPNFIPVKQPNLAAVNAGKNSTNVVPPTTIVNANKASGYTIQLIADDSLSSVDNFIAVNQLKNNAQALKTSRNGKTWYIVVYGNYPTTEAAANALSTMPSGLHNQHPFIRKLSDVQSKMVS